MGARAGNLLHSSRNVSGLLEIDIKLRAQLLYKVAFRGAVVYCDDAHSLDRLSKALNPPESNDYYHDIGILYREVSETTASTALISPLPTHARLESIPEQANKLSSAHIAFLDTTVCRHAATHDRSSLCRLQQ
jgi:hypothetical protein